MSELIKDEAVRFIKSSSEGKINLTDELSILEYLVKRFKLKTISQYEKENNISYPGALKRIESKKLMIIQLGNINFIIN